MTLRLSPQTGRADALASLRSAVDAAVAGSVLTPAQATQLADVSNKADTTYVDIQDSALSGRIDTLEAAPAGGTTPAEQAAIAANTAAVATKAEAAAVNTNTTDIGNLQTDVTALGDAVDGSALVPGLASGRRGVVYGGTIRNYGPNGKTGSAPGDGTPDYFDWIDVHGPSGLGDVRTFDDRIEIDFDAAVSTLEDHGFLVGPDNLLGAQGWTAGASVGGDTVTIASTTTWPTISISRIRGESTP